MEGEARRALLRQPSMVASESDDSSAPSDSSDEDDPADRPFIGSMQSTPLREATQLIRSDSVRLGFEEQMRLRSQRQSR
jgi:hypothetical protein